VEAFRTSVFDLVLMDIMMPEMDGLEATQLIRSTAPVFVAALTASIESKDELKCITCGMDRVLFKPVKVKELEEVIKAAAARSQHATELVQSAAAGHSGSTTAARSRQTARLVRPAYASASLSP